MWPAGDSIFCALLVAVSPAAGLVGKTRIQVESTKTLLTVLDHGFGMDVGGRIDVRVATQSAGSACTNIQIENFGDVASDCSDSAVACVAEESTEVPWGTLNGVRYTAIEACCKCGGGIRAGGPAAQVLDVVLLTAEQMYIARRREEHPNSDMGYRMEVLSASTLNNDNMEDSARAAQRNNYLRDCTAHAMHCQRQFVDYGLCTMPTSYRKQFVGEVAFSYTVPYRNKYTVGLLNCGGHALNADIEITALNPGPDGEGMSHLPSEKLRLPDFYLSIATVAIGLLCIWVVHVAPFPAICHRQMQQRGWPWPQRERGQHRAPLLIYVYTLAAVGKCTELCATTTYYKRYAIEGVESTDLDRVRDYCVIFTSALAMAAMILAALGWRTIRETITTRERNFMIGGLLLYAFSGVAYKMCGSGCSGYLLTHYVLQFFISFSIIVAMNANIERLRAQVGGFR
jgi:hypothetical protein